MADTKKAEGLVYKNHPLRRVDNFIYYGSMADKYIVLLQILDTVKEQDMDVAKRVSVQLQLTDPDLKSRDRVVKKNDHAMDDMRSFVTGVLGSGTAFAVRAPERKI